MGPKIINSNNNRIQTPLALREEYECCINREYLDWTEIRPEHVWRKTEKHKKFSKENITKRVYVGGVSVDKRIV